MVLLIVEDNRHLRRMLRELIVSAYPDVQVVEAEDGRSCMTLCLARHPDIVLMDVALPDASGIELTARIRRMAPAATVVMISNSTTVTHQEQALLAGAACFIAKFAVRERLLPAIAAIRDSAGRLVA